MPPREAAAAVHHGAVSSAPLAVIHIGI
ncbi:MAG: hypothetical protein JWM18_4329, partial [Chloroflexi bacterium]|nr:hypothetical protein [Chloroflexota bacterium]